MPFWMRPLLNSSTLGGRQMSYDISLYDRGFLKRAIESNLGDWTDADPIEASAAERLIAIATDAGFRRVPSDPAFVEFCREQGVAPVEELLLETPEILAQLSLHRGQLAFTIPYSPLAQASIALCSMLARLVAQEHHLAFYDPQEGVAEY